VPPRFDIDGTVDGYTSFSGTGAPTAMVAAAATWIRAFRPHLRASQVADVLRLSARDLERPGRDELTGWGLPQIHGALAKTAPPADHGEPNDDIAFVDGTALAVAARPIWSGGSPRTIRARLDRFEYPADVYPLRLPAGARVRVIVEPAWGDPDLAAFPKRTRSTNQQRRALGRSRHVGGRVDSLVLNNRLDKARPYYVETRINRLARRIDAAYALTVTSAR